MGLPASNDEALVGIIQRGDGSGDSAKGFGDSAEAFGLLLERTLPVIHARVDFALAHAESGRKAARMGSREDLLQEGKLAFLSAVSSFQPGRGASFRTYVSVCVSHRVASALRRKDPWEGFSTYFSSKSKIIVDKPPPIRYD